MNSSPSPDRHSEPQARARGRGQDPCPSRDGPVAGAPGSDRPVETPIAYRSERPAPRRRHGRTWLAGGFLAAMVMGVGLTLADIKGSKHDFSRKEWAGGESCGACHSPHTVTPPKAAPLWDPAADLQRTFGTAIGEKPTPGAGTSICLRCHDGTVARDTLGGVRAERFVHHQNPAVFGTGHGSSDHPVGVDYPQSDPGYRPMTAVLAEGKVKLPSGKVECTSCHDPHNTSGVEHMLVTTNRGSALCLTCHVK